MPGANGFIGRHLLPKLSDYNVICGGYNELPETIPDYIIHLAAVTTTSDSFIPELFDSNIVYTKQIMSIPTRIIYASSTSAAELTNPYAYTKRYIEHLAIGKNATGLRFFNIYGHGNNKGIVKAALEKDRLIINGGQQVRDFIYIDDAVRAIIDNLDSPPGLVDVGTGKGMTIMEAIAVIERVKGRRLEIMKLPPSKTDMQYSVASPGIPGCIGFEEGIMRMLKL